jgi:hypothetical protein
MSVFGRVGDEFPPALDGCVDLARRNPSLVDQAVR